MTGLLEGHETSFNAITQRIMNSLAESGVVADPATGSVVRTVVESFAREMATFYEMLERAHEAGYVDTAEGQALDNVVAILGVERARAGRLSGHVEFSRLTPAPKDITVPAGLRVTGPEQPDGAAVPILETVEETVIRRGDRMARAAVQEVPEAETDEWGTLNPDTLTILPRPVLGIESVTNPEPVSRGGEEEADDDLRARARVALRETQRSTAEAIEAAVKELGIERVRVVEPREGPAGTIDVVIADPEIERDEARRQAVEEAVLRAKAAGVRVNVKYPRTVYFAFTVDVETEDPDLDDAGFARLEAELRVAVSAYVAALGPGTQVNLRKLTAALLNKPSVRDVTVDATTFTLQATETETQPEAVDDTGRRELPDGSWYVAPLETAAVDLQRWPPGFTRRLPKLAHLDLSVAVAATALPAETVKDTIRAAGEAYLTRLIPDPEDAEKRRRLVLDDLSSELSATAFVKEIRAATVMHPWNALAEDDLTAGDAFFVEGERVTVRRIDLIGAA